MFRIFIFTHVIGYAVQPSFKWTASIKLPRIEHHFCEYFLAQIIGQFFVFPEHAIKKAEHGSGVPGVNNIKGAFVLYRNFLHQGLVGPVVIFMFQVQNPRFEKRYKLSFFSFKENLNQFRNGFAMGGGDKRQEIPLHMNPDGEPSVPFRFHCIPFQR
jgi:hypothetical protein